MQKDFVTENSGFPEKAPVRPVLGKAGFSLIEVLVAMVLLMVGLGAWMQLQIAAIKVNDASKKLLMAQDKVSQELEQIKSIGYSNIKSNSVLKNSTFGYKSTLAELVAMYQLTGIDTSCNSPALYCVYKGVQVVKTVKGTPVNYNYTVKLAVNPGYLIYPEIAKVDATVYWQNGTVLKNMLITSFVGM